MAGELVERLRRLARNHERGFPQALLYTELHQEAELAAADRIEALERENATLRASRPSKHVRAIWAGDDEVLPAGSEIEILCSDPLDPSVPARRACWVRHWPGNRDYPLYRSCDLSDLEEISEGDFDMHYEAAAIRNKGGGENG